MQATTEPYRIVSVDSKWFVWGPLPELVTTKMWRWWLSMKMGLLFKTEWFFLCQMCAFAITDDCVRRVYTRELFQFRIKHDTTFLRGYLWHTEVFTYLISPSHQWFVIFVYGLCLVQSGSILKKKNQSVFFCGFICANNLALCLQYNKLIHLKTVLTKRIKPVWICVCHIRTPKSNRAHCFLGTWEKNSCLIQTSLQVHERVHQAHFRISSWLDLLAKRPNGNAAYSVFFHWYFL